MIEAIVDRDHRDGHGEGHGQETPPSFWRSRFGLGWLVLAGVAGWFLWTEHRAHLLGFVPYALLLACPLMHVFMHRGHHHGSHHGHGHEAAGPAAQEGRASAGDAKGDRS